MKRVLNAMQFAAGAALLAGIGWLAYLALSGLRRAFAYVVSLESETAAAIIAASATIAISIITLLVTKYLEARTAVRHENRSRKIPVYEEIVSFVFRVFYQEKIRERRLSEQELVKIFAGTTEKIIIWGSDDVLRAYVNFRNMAVKTTEQKTNVIDPLFRLESLLLAIRKDLGHGSSGIRRGEVLSLFINDIGDHT